MGSLRYLFLDLWRSIKWVLKSKYRWFLIAFLVWFYRIEYVSGSGQTIQAVSFLVFTYLMFEYRNGIMWYTLNKTHGGTRGIFIFYLYAIVTCIWSFMPAFSLAILFQNTIIFLTAVWIFTIPRTFRQTEHVFMLVGMGIVLFNAIVLRLTWQHSLFAHHLAGGSVAAMMLCYSTAELLNMPFTTKKIDIARRKMFIGSIIVSSIVLAISTSSGANVSAVFGCGIAFLLSKKRGYGVLLLLVAGILFFNQEVIEDLLTFLMPGKSAENISSATGREVLWNYEYEFISQKPLFGWGFACVERAITEMTDFPAMDAHNSYLGLIGGLGFVGFTLFLIVLFFIFYFIIRNMRYKGYHGILCAISCALLNGYSFGFLSGKTCSITILFLMLVALTAGYRVAHRYERVRLALKK